MSAIKLNTILNNTSMKFIASIDPKTITSIEPFSNVMLDDKVVQQLELELAQSYKLFKNKVKRFLSNEVQINNLEQVFQEYIAGLESIEDKSPHSEFHIQLMTSNKQTKQKWLQVALTELIAQELTTSRYVELNHIAYLVGKTLNNKEYNGDAVIALSLGANILEFFRSINLVTKGYQINQEKHRIASIKVNRNVIKVPNNLLQAANSIRANSPMLVTPLKHSPLSEGGQLLRRCVMLNNAKLDHGMKFYNAVNYLNSQALKIRTNNDIINQWFMTERFYSDALTELKQEKTKVLNDLELFSKDRFYISYEADSRGRLYSTSNYINPQGDSFQKSMFVGEAEVLTEDGINALKISIVNEIHSDKITREQALEWFDTNQDKLKLNTPLSQVYYQDYLQAKAGRPVGSILHQDMTNSGLGIYSLLGKDEKGAVLTNLKNIGKLADAYKALADTLNKVLGITNLNRSTVKKAFMVFLYGSGKALLTSEDIDDERYKHLLQAIEIGLGTTIDVDKVWVKFQEAMFEIAPAAIKLMELIYKFKKEDSHYKWVMNDGFIVDIQVMNKQAVEHKGYSISLDGKTHTHTIHTIEELKDSKYDKSLAPHVIHSIDAYILREIARRCAKLGIPLYTIHDSFGTTPNYYFELNEIVRQVLADVLEMDLLEDILSQIDSAKLQLAINRGMLPKGELTREDILNAVNAVR